MKLIVPTSLYLFLSVLVLGIPDTWNTNTTYNKNDVVLYTPSGTSEAKNYIALETGAGNQPDTSTAFWSLLDAVASSFSAPPGDPTTFSTPDTNTIPTDSPPDSNSSVTASGAPSASNEAFVMQQYIDILGREAGEGGLNFYANKLNTGASTRADLVNEFVFSDEFQDKIAPITRIYQAVFLRNPNTSGLTFWVNQKIYGVSMFDISKEMTKTEEFNAKYGELSNEDFVKQIYRNVQGREGAVDGVNFWTNALNNGASRGEVMLEFSESSEFKTKTLSGVRVIAFYYSLLRRAPAQDGYEFWRQKLDWGVSPISLIDGFLSSSEYLGRF